MKTIIPCTRLIALLGAVALLAGVFVGPAAWAAPVPGGGCPAINAIGNFVVKNEISASFTDVGSGTAEYKVTTPNEIANPGDTVPGLIAYCVYTSPLPDTRTPVYDAWVSHTSVVGWFNFVRPDGNPTNIPFDGTTQTVGRATWSSGTVPTTQTILLHINSHDECTQLYPDGNSDTCFVYPGGGGPGPLTGCPDGNVACKDVVITDLSGVVDPQNLELKTDYVLTYDYLIFNNTGQTMYFYVPGPKTQDINSGGAKDYFGCEQIPFGSNNPTSVDGFKIVYKFGKGTCDQSRFFMTAYGSTVTLAPDASISFTIEMHLRRNKGKQQEYTSCGQHFLNSGFTVKWFYFNDPLLHSFTTSPLSINVTVGCDS